MTGTDSSHGSSNGSAYASASAVAGLAREIEALRRTLDRLQDLPGRLDELAGLVAQLAETAAANTYACPTSGVASGRDLPTEIDTTQAVLKELTCWMQRVYLRYSDAAASLPECWLWHPDVIEELLWLQQSWLAAYRDTHAPVSAAADWHDRYRPGVIRRIKDTAGRCSLENHQPRDDHPTPGRAPVVPLTEATDPIATWWATHRSAPPPQPDTTHLAAAANRHPGSRR
jgi:hypothetical protein